MNGTLHDLNVVLSGVMYQRKPNFVGQDRIIVHAVDSQLAAADPETIYLSISPIEHLPHIVINKQQLIVYEDFILGITDVSVEVGNFSAAKARLGRITAGTSTSFSRRSTSGTNHYNVYFSC
jgi:hypothetical protein